MNTNVYPVDTNRSKLGRDLVDDLRELWIRFTRIEASFKTMEQQKDTGFGTLTTRTNDTSGVVTLNSDVVAPANGIIIDFNWSGGSRIKCLITNVAGQVITFSGGEGDNLPAQDTVVTLSHFTTVADAFRFVDEYTADAETPDDPSVASRAFKELDSLINNSAALRQAVARFRQ